MSFRARYILTYIEPCVTKKNIKRFLELCLSELLLHVSKIGQSHFPVCSLHFQSVTICHGFILTHHVTDYNFIKRHFRLLTCICSFAMAEEQGGVKMAQDCKLRVVEVMPPAG